MAYESAREEKTKLPFSDDELLRYVASERQDAVGFDNHDEQLYASREKALEYFRGEVRDLPKLKNRSQVVSTDVSDAVETAFPDIMEVFFGGDDIVTFRPTDDNDREKAEQETEAIVQIMTEENPGFFNFSHVIKDALITRTGVWRMWWEDPQYDEQERDVNAIELQQLMQSGVEILDVESEEPDETAEAGIYSVRLRVMKHPGMAKYEPIPSEDFAVARDTVRLSDATYSAHRARPRMQDLIAQGYDADKVRNLPPYDASSTEQIQNDRDFADEHDYDALGMGDLARVEVVYHVIKLLKPDTKELQYYSVCTGNNEATLLHAEEIEYVPYAALTPYLVPHRMFGRSVADMMIEIQKVKTNLVRMMLDHGLFAINQRHEVADDLANQYTISDLLNNIPGAPVRVRQTGGIKPIANAGLSFDVLSAMETIDVAGEKRTGIMRFGQGLKADTLHETMGGAIEQAAMMMKRIRLMARWMAETGVKDLALGLHKIMRLHSTHQFKLRRNDQFIPLDPTEWGDRQDMSIEIGVGSGGRNQKIENRKILGDAMGAVLGYQAQKLVGPVVTTEHAANYLEGLIRDLGYKDASRFVSDPKEAGQQQPDPEKEQLQQGLQQAQSEIQNLQNKQQTEVMKIQQKAEADRYKADMDAKMKQMQMQMEGQLKAQQMQMEALLKRLGMQMDNDVKREANMRDVQFGGEVG